MRWENLSKVLEKLGEWFLHAGLLFLRELVIQPFVKGNNSLIWKGLIAILISVPLGAILIWISENIKSDKEGEI